VSSYTQITAMEVTALAEAALVRIVRMREEEKCSHIELNRKKWRWRLFKWICGREATDDEILEWIDHPWVWWWYDEERTAESLLNLAMLNGGKDIFLSAEDAEHLAV
jgi:hypothetical protein